MELNNSSPSLYVDLIGSINAAKRETVNIANVVDTFELNGNTFPSFDILNSNREYILSLCIKQDIPESEFYKPEYTSTRLYGTPSLWYILLFVNSLNNAYEYKEKNILVLNPKFITHFVTFVSSNPQKHFVIDDLTIQVIPER